MQPLHVFSERLLLLRSEARRWVRPWYIAYAILGALASGLEVILLPAAVARGGGTPGQIGLVVAMMNVGVLASPFWGMLAERLRLHLVVFFAGFLLAGLGFLGFALGVGEAVWIVCALLIGLGIGAANTVAGLFVVAFMPPEEWNRRISWMQTFNATGQVCGLLIAGMFLPRHGMLIAAALVLPAFYFGSRGLPPGVRRRAPLAAVSLVGTRSHGFDLAGQIAALTRSFLSRFTVFLLGWFIIVVATSSLYALYPVLMGKLFGISVAAGATLYAVAASLRVPLYGVAGALTTRFGPAWIFAVGIAARVVAFSGLSLVAFLHPPFGVPIVCLLVVLSEGVWALMVVSSINLAGSLTTIGQGAGMGLYNAMAALASASGAVLGGTIAGRFGYANVCVCAAVGSAIALVCIGALALQAPSPPRLEGRAEAVG
jgi:MFS family permease